MVTQSVKHKKGSASPLVCIIVTSKLGGELFCSFAASSLVVGVTSSAAECALSAWAMAPDLDSPTHPELSILASDGCYCCACSLRFCGRGVLLHDTSEG